MYKLLFLLLVTQLFSDEVVMEKFDDLLYISEYKWIEEQGIKEFKYHNCNKAYTKNTIVSKEVKVADELLKYITNYAKYISYISDPNESEEGIIYSKKSIVKIQKELTAFFLKHKNQTNVNILYTPVDVFYKDAWKCEDQVKLGLLTKFKYYDADIANVIYTRYKKELKQLLDTKSFTLLGLISGDFTYSDDDISRLIKHFKYNKNLLSTLISQNRFKVVDKYKDAFNKNYSKNPFYLTIKKASDNKTENEITKIRSLGYNLFTYAQDINNTKIEHNDDNLYLAIKYNLHTYSSKGRKSTRYTLDELIQNIKNLDTLDAYIYYAIEHSNRYALNELFEKYPNQKYTKHDISRYILHASKRHSLYMTQYLVNNFPYDEYDDIVDEETGLNALGYAKEDRYSGEQRVAFLQKHNFNSQFFKDRGRNIGNFFSDAGEVFSGIGLVFGGGMGR